MADAGNYPSMSTEAPNLLGTTAPGGSFEDGPASPHDPEKQDGRLKRPGMALAEEDEEEEEDMDQLIQELESEDGQIDPEEEEDVGAGADAPPVDPRLLETSTRTGLTKEEVATRRKRFGLNQMKEEKENLVLKFLGYFVGPIQFVMEVCRHAFHSRTYILVLLKSKLIFAWSPCSANHEKLCINMCVKDADDCTHVGRCHPCGWLDGLGRLRGHLCSASAQCLCRLHSGISGWIHRRRAEKDACPQGGGLARRRA
jgi:hypothetical protein